MSNKNTDIFLERSMKYLTYMIIATSFFGSYLGIPGNENIFLFRILIPIHLVGSFFVRKINMPKNISLVVIYGIYFVLMTFTLFWSTNVPLSLRYIYFIFEWLYVFFICIYYVRSFENYGQLARIVSIIYFLMLIIGVVECLTGKHLALSGSLYYETSTSKYEPTAFMFNTNDFASVLSMFYPICMSYIYSIREKILRILMYILCSSLTVYLVIETNSRVSMIVVLLEIVIFVVNSSVVWGLFYLVLGSLFSATFLAISNSNNQLIEIVIKSFTDKNASNSDRMEMYEASWKIIEQSHFLGVGAGELPEKLSNYMYGFQRIGDNYWAPHNYWLETFANGGILSITVLLIFFSRYFWLATRILQKTRFSLLRLVPLLIGISFVASSIGLSSTIDKRHLAIGLGIGLIIINLLREEN